MAYSRSPINTCGSFNTGEKSALLKTFDNVQAEIDAGGAFTPTDAPAILAGAFGSTSSAIVDATGTFSQTITNNNNRALEDKINALIVALSDTGILV